MKNENEETINSWHRFLDLPLELSVELGRTRLKIRDILNLAPSSIIKLTRSTGEGVDIRADNKSLLRGEIVVLEDRAGVRVTEIVKEDN
ncbi:MAG: FliM/FliN family flagellar motor switch protein [Acidobacteria bacterium]|nr:FliM/FliN family flagellar motor switch protein [Acidobacteriota bacterium]